MCSVFCKGHYENVETWQQILFHLFSCLLACQDGAVSGASPSSQLFAFSLCLCLPAALVFLLLGVHSPLLPNNYLKRTQRSTVIWGSLCHSEFFQQFYRTTSGLHMSLNGKGPATVLVVGAAVEMRITQKIMISGWIFTKGFSHSLSGIFEGNLSRKGWYKTNERCWGNLNESTVEFFITFLTNQSQEKFLHFFSIFLCLLGNFTSNLTVSYSGLCIFLVHYDFSIIISLCCVSFLDPQAEM